jgi:hypothetical protein
MLAELAYVRKPAANLIAKVKIHTLPACLVDVTIYTQIGPTRHCQCISPVYTHRDEWDSDFIEKK